MLRTLVLADNLMIEIPKSLLDVIGDELCVHLMLIGISPFTIIQETPVLSPALKESSPNENGEIDGGTARDQVTGNREMTGKIIVSKLFFIFTNINFYF